MAEELKPCPHCGGKAYLERDHRAFINAQSARVSFVRCTVCNARSGRFMHKPENTTAEACQKAIEAWNKRV